jgi:hypothetical protein
MAAPVYSAGTPGNLINYVSVAASKNAAAFLDLSTSIEGQLTCETIVGSSAPTGLTTFSAYKAYAAGSSAPITLSASATAGATSLSVSSKTGLSIGQTVCLQQAGGSKLGELSKITAISGSSSPYTLTVGATINSYSSGDYVYLMAQTASFAVAPASTSGTYSASTDYSSELFLGPGQWIVSASNADSSVSITANATYDRITAIA